MNDKEIILGAINKELYNLRATIVGLQMDLAHCKENHARELDQYKKDLDSKLKEATDSSAMFGQGLSAVIARMELGK